MGHPTVEQFRSDCLDACELRRMGFLNGGTHRLAAGLRWPKLESITVDPSAVTITYRNSGRSEVFRLSWAKAFRNSERPWIVCNHCRQRYARLYRGFAGYGCRECLEFWYQCQTVSSCRRMKRPRRTMQAHR